MLEFSARYGTGAFALDAEFATARGITALF